ncbi:hypothetical protein [Kaistella chaponensis]|nr:hypothetical protein [Kaistella chaponensis]
MIFEDEQDDNTEINARKITDNHGKFHRKHSNPMETNMANINRLNENENA